MNVAYKQKECEEIKECSNSYMAFNSKHRDNNCPKKVNLLLLYFKK